MSHRHVLVTFVSHNYHVVSVAQSFCSAIDRFKVFGRPFLNGSPYAMRPLSCLSVYPVCLSVYDVRALWPNGWMDQDETPGAGRPRPWPHCVRWVRAQPPIFSPYLLWPNGWMHQDAT